ncbi:GTPase [Geomonas silvestris]|uniref:GTPase n=1 Tax=Geomonas silvestris TaxID=2740184 RepID=A0A6V8MPU7_9BACT|nr:roadblock/LC7 domain-containing protein [Geomonas silvestris]GFO62021.1 GTPase [Geomonas silvestris]
MPFKRLLTDLVEAVPGASGAILADWEGEAVEQHCFGDPYDMKVTAAHWGIMLTQLKDLQQKLHTGAVREALISTDRQYAIVGALGDDYALVMTMTDSALPLVALHSFRETAVLLMKEIY